MAFTDVFNLPGPSQDIADIQLELQTWPEVKKYLAVCKAIIIPIGSTEQHGPTGAIGTDAMTAQSISLEVGKRTGVLVTPAQSFGMAEHHLGFPGTMSLRPATFISLIHDLVLSLAGAGFERIFVINGHGGNIASTKAAFTQAYSSALARGIPSASKLRCKLVNWFMCPSVFSFSKELYGDREGQHATPSEIAITLHLFPSLIKKQKPLPDPPANGPIYGAEDFSLRYPDGRIGSDPFLAKSQHGEILLDKAASAICKDLSEFVTQL